MKPGDKVICIDEGPCRNQKSDWFGCESPLVAGRVYVIRSTRPTETKLLVRLVGVELPFYEDEEMGFNSIRFRLLNEIKSETKQHESCPS